MSVDGRTDFSHSTLGGAGSNALRTAELRVFLLRAATHIEQTIFPLLEKMLGELQQKIESSRSNVERQQLSDAFVALHKRKPLVQAQFSKQLREAIERELTPVGSPNKPTIADISVQGLAIVDDEQINEEIEAKRTALKILTHAEWELREATSYINALQGLEEMDQRQNPLRPEIISLVLHRALIGVSEDKSTIRLLENNLGESLSKAMSEGYRRVADDLKRRNVKPLEYAARQSEGTGYISGMDAGPSLSSPLEQTLIGGISQEIQAQTAMSLTQSLEGALSAVFGLAAGSGAAGVALAGSVPRYYGPSSYESADVGMDSQRGPMSRSGPSSGGGVYSRQGPDSIGGWSTSQGMNSRRQATSRLAEMLLDLRGRVWGAPTDVRSVSVRNARGFGDSGFADSTRNARSFASTEPFKPSTFGASTEGAMLNPVRAHLQQLQEATTGPFRMTIEVVALLFDEILSDKKLQPLAARLIARMQLPLLDVALTDPNLFTRPDHPLHALINRLGSAAAAFDIYESGPGQRFYAAALTIVEEILESDFQSLETYRNALDKLNAFLKHEALVDNPFHTDAAHMLASKEIASLMSRHLSKRTEPLVAGLSIPEFLKVFFSRTWVPAQVEAVLRFGEKSPESHRFSRLCSDLVWSIQPKISAEEKRQLVAALPHLMRDINEAFEMLKWPPLEQKEFRARLIEHQARAMKTLPEEEADNLRRIEESRQVINDLKNMSVPTLEELHATAMESASQEEFEYEFTDAEKSLTGYITFDELTLRPQTDVLLFDEVENALANNKTEENPVDKEEGSMNFPTIDAEVAQEQNRSLLPGLAYEVNIHGLKRKLRLAWISDMRSLYLFDDCSDAKRKTTLSARSLAHLWLTKAIDEFESEPLMGRAITAARKHLLAPH